VGEAASSAGCSRVRDPRPPGTEPYDFTVSKGETVSRTPLHQGIRLDSGGKL